MPLSRRAFVSGLLATPLAADYLSFAATVAPMKITRVETVYWKSPEDAPFRPNWIWIKIDTDAGISGIGETYPRNAVEAAMVHTVAPSLIGRDPLDIERIWTDLYREFDFQIAGGTEMRVLSALDLAFWDLLGKSLNAPVYRLIGGKANPPDPLVQHLFPLQVRFQSRAREDHARADRYAGH
jgi:galactonate dehydratase